MTSAIRNPNPIDSVRPDMHVYYFNPITNKIRDGYVMAPSTDGNGKTLVAVSEDKTNEHVDFRPLEYMFETLEGLTAALEKEIERQAEKLASEIETVEDLVTFAAYNDISFTENFAGIRRKAYIKKAKELLGLDLD